MQEETKTKTNEDVKVKPKKRLWKFILILLTIVIILLGVVKLVEETIKVSIRFYDWTIDLFDGELNEFTLIYKANKRAEYPELRVLIGTPMEEYIPHIIKASEYYELPVTLYLGIANAESSFRKFRCENPWGIDTGKGNDPRCYSSVKHSVDGFSQLLRYYYFDEGLKTADELWRKYQSGTNPDWITNVKKYYK